jgi:magnesium and cobalt transporter
VDLRRHLRPVRHVPDSKPAGALLEEFRRSRSPIAIVVDELGRATGLVTLADLLEVIVGEIRDEEDRRAALVQLPGGGADLAGYLPTERVNEELGTRIPESEAYDTIGGFVVTRFGRVPSQGESVREGEFEFTVLDADGRRVHRLRIVPVAAMVRPGPAPAP